MTNENFRTIITEAFGTHTFMKDKNRHTVNELVYVLRYDDAFKGNDYNISIRRHNGEWWCIPTLDSFVSISCLSVWFDDYRLEFDVEEYEGTKYNCITIYESEETK